MDREQALNLSFLAPARSIGIGKKYRRSRRRAA